MPHFSGEALHTRYLTRDPEEASELFRSFYGPLDLSANGSDRFSFAQQRDGDTTVTAGWSEYGGQWQVDGRLARAVTIAWPIAGSLHWETAGEQGVDGVALFEPEQRLRTRLDDTKLGVITLDRDALEQTARTVYGNERLTLKFDGARPASPDLQQFLLAVAASASDALADPAASDLPMIRAAVQRQVAVATLETFRLDLDVADRRASFAAQQAAYRRASDYLRERVATPVTAEDAARYVGMSTVELTRAFRAHAHCTPTEFLRRLRLAAAHDDLAAADPGTTVAAIARRWGFASTSAFSRRYRAVFGMPPELRSRAGTVVRSV